MTAATPPSRVFSVLLIAAISGLSSCVSPPPPPPPPVPVKKVAPPLYSWDPAKVKTMRGTPSIVIDLTKQRATYYRAGQELGWTTVATGTWKHPTPTGRFRVMEKVVDKVSNLYGKMLDKDGKVVESDAKAGETPMPEGGSFEGAKMQYFMRFTGDGVGMHVGPIPRPGRPASHGCVRTPRIMAERFFEITPVGTPVAIIETPREPDPSTLPPPAPPKKRFFGLFGSKAAAPAASSATGSTAATTSSSAKPKS